MKIPVLVPNIFDHPFTYETSNLELIIGDYVNVPFGKKTMTGVIWDHFEEKKYKNFQIKKVLKKLDIQSMNENTIKFFNWFSEYNIVPRGMSLKLHLLSGEAIENFKDKDYEEYQILKKTSRISLSDEQSNNLKEILKNDKKFKKKFENFFGYPAAIWHSGITKKKKKIIWSGISSNKIKAVIGARSALFLPFNNLGLIVVDEEHDQSYKQNEGVIYNARDMAISRASFENIPINLVTAVPSIETYENIKKQKFSYSRLLKRFKDAKLPNHEMIDLNKFKLYKNSWISPKTIEKVNFHLSKGDQVLFFLNRRGFSPYVLCKNCLKVFSCPNCSINLVYHKQKKNLLCHYCGHKEALDRKCDKSGKCEFVFSGPGVERISEEVKKILPQYKSLIFSSDTMNKKSSLELLEKIINNEIKILIGTQLISKGFHFPNLNCIVVIDSDLTLQGHDLRAAEKNLQLYHQLSGRAGRTGKPATVYFQTYNLKDNNISNITNTDPFIFLEKELELRKRNKLPPYERFICLILNGKNEKKLEKEAYNLKIHLQKNIQAKILGPVNALIYKIKKNYRVRLLIRSKRMPMVQKTLRKALKDFQFSSGIKLTVDVDPISFN